MPLHGRDDHIRHWRVVVAAALAAAAAAVPVAALARPTGPHAAMSRQRADAATVSSCVSASTLTWLGVGNGGGTLERMFYPIEISNTSTRICALTGFPAVWAVSGTGVQVGLPATAGGTARRVVLGPGKTVHAVLAITPARDVPGCKQRPRSYLQVRLPGQQPATTIPGLPITACANASVLRVGPVQAGTGIPGRAGPLSTPAAP